MLELTITRIPRKIRGRLILVLSSQRLRGESALVFSVVSMSKPALETAKGGRCGLWSTALPRFGMNL